MLFLLRGFRHPAALIHSVELICQPTEHKLRRLAIIIIHDYAAEMVGKLAKNTSIHNNVQAPAPERPTTIVNISAPEVSCLEVNTLEVNTPEVSGLEVGGPEVGGPEVGGLEVGRLEVGRLEVGGPEVSAPEVGGLEVGGLEVSGPEGGGPEVSGPEVSLSSSFFVT